MLRWVNAVLQEAHGEIGYDRVIENFGSDLRDSEALAMLIAACSRWKYGDRKERWIQETLVNEDLFMRAQEVIQRAHQLGSPSLLSTLIGF